MKKTKYHCDWHCYPFLILINMAQHKLSVEAPDTLNTFILRLVDTSVYDPNMAVDCPILEITLPGFTHPVQFTTPDITTGFIKKTIRVYKPCKFLSL